MLTFFFSSSNYYYFLKVTVVIHQPNAPLWQIRGWEINLSSQTTQKNKKGKNYNNIPTSHQLHIAYHGGDHYDSVRRLGDTSHIPANIQIDAESEANVGTTERCENTADQVSDYDTCNIHEINIADDTVSVFTITKFRKNGASYYVIDAQFCKPGSQRNRARSYFAFRMSGSRCRSPAPLQ